jgi:hypothetical protein
MALFSSSSLNTTPDTSGQQTVSTYAQPYVNNLLDKSAGMLNAPTPTYTGQLTAGYSPLQQDAWQGLSGLTLPTSLQTAGTNLQNISNQEQNLSYNPNTITAQSFDANQAQQYMNPYIQASLDPQLAALQRQQAINQQGDLAKLTQAGAYGGSRQAILQAQNNENLLRQQAGLIGSGYNQAYQNAATQFNADAARNLQAQQLNQASNQFGATYGLQGLQAATQAQTAAANAGAQGAQYGLANLQALNTAGGQQQSLDQQALNAQYNEYLRQLQYPQTMLTLNKNMLTGLPMTTTNNFTAAKSASQQLAGGIAGVSGIVDSLMGKGFTQAQTADYLKKMFTDSTGKQNLTDAQIQAELDRATAEANKSNAPPTDAVPDGAGNYTRNNNGNIETYDSQGNLIAMNRDPATIDTYVPPEPYVPPTDLTDFTG